MITNKSLIQHVPDFLDYCNTEGLKNNTQENYKRFLDKFIGWLKLKKLNGLLPHQLTPEHILEYRLHLSCYKEPKTGKSLAKVTQNYYLIALRALLGYFIAKDIVSLPPDKITLYRGDKSAKNQNYPNPEQIKALLAAPGGKTPIALRDKVMLYTIVSAGLKIKQVINLNKNSINNLPENILPYIEDYLKIRKDDKEDALFINYRSRKGASRRLTPRAIQKIIKRYSINVGLSSSTTPETLRFANVLAIWNKKIEIKNALWQETEDAVDKEIAFLKEGISILPERYRGQTALTNLIKCDNCIFRKIATLVVGGFVRVQKRPVQNIWPGFYFDDKERKLLHHGRNWHKKMIDSIVQYLKKIDSSNKIIIEPILNYGRADIGIFDENKHPIYIEVGTVSAFKVWYNLVVMPNSIFILVPNDDFIIKFEN